jgi:rhamnosyltransferase
MGLVLSELRYFRQRDVWQIPSALARTLIKFLGYRLGRIESMFAPGIKCQASMHLRF